MCRALGVLDELLHLRTERMYLTEAIVPSKRFRVYNFPALHLLLVRIRMLRLSR